MADGLDALREVKDYAIYMLDKNGFVRTWNEGARAIKGYTADEIVGSHFCRFFTPQDQADGRPQRLLSTAVAQGRAEDQAWRVRKDGTRFWADVVITAIHDKSDELVGFVKVTRDLTERRNSEERMRQSEERLRLLVENVRDYAIFMLDRRGFILSWNAGAQRITGYAAEEVIGRHFSIFYPSEQCVNGHPTSELEIAERTGRYQEEGLRLRKSGEAFWANVVITAVHEPGTGQLRGFAKVTRDLTERKRAEEALRAATEQAISERLRAEEARNALKIRDEFLSVAAHELRTPLAVLLLKLQGVEVLTAKHAHDAATMRAKVEERVASALRQVERLGQLVQRLLDVSGIVRGQLNVKREGTSLSALAKKVVDDYEDAAAAAGCALQFVASGAAHGSWDAFRIEQVITNLLSNAIKYGAGRPIEVRVTESGDTVSVSVRDEGIGIKPQDAERIFGRFERAVSIDNYSGLGLGLYIAKSIVDAHGGAIRVTSDIGQGSTFTVSLPRVAPLAEVSMGGAQERV